MGIPTAIPKSAPKAHDPKSAKAPDPKGTKIAEKAIAAESSSGGATIVLTLCRKDQTVEVAIRKMGNSQGVLIPKPILAQVGLQGAADLQVRDGVIEIRAISRNPREGWADDARRLAELGGDVLVWPELANEGDSNLVW